jgi:hypothetical protein
MFNLMKNIYPSCFCVHSATCHFSPKPATPQKQELKERRWVEFSVTQNGWLRLHYQSGGNGFFGKTKVFGVALGGQRRFLSEALNDAVLGGGYSL